MLSIRLLHAELIKAKRTSVIYLAIVIPIIYSLLTLFILFFEQQKESFHLLPDFGWLYMFLPLGLTILTSLSSNVFYSNNMWKIIMIQPISRVSFYINHLLFIKLLILTGCIVLSICSIFINIILFQETPLPWNSIISSCLISWVCSMPVISFQVLIGIKFKSIAASLSIGIAGFFFSLISYYQASFLGMWHYPLSTIEGNNSYLIILSIFLSCFFTVIGVISLLKTE
ncbi:MULTISPECIES: ABC transporter permease [Bacillus]|uniref:ABC transporter permease n=1 Tax=Bacillus cereus TaxID=1396 RepID=A0A2C1LY63_BACCE|nr:MULTISPECIES: ABC transporter permease [Bacillus]PGL82313.1 hypothetical protein CN931_15135 [Bacillus sp. AFS054943]PGX02473.1 hypothetical protein COE07_24950 [Bacillus sp. AFS033286]PER22515.1 hypothetical protein CN476_20540 [Bacillus cereus]PFA61915.1 hypothetical protein CN402_09800 [Bacillus sp. AFS015896]PGU02910.1 hypothetical protein COD19_11430 [Bacillus cereus]